MFFQIFSWKIICFEKNKKLFIFILKKKTVFEKREAILLGVQLAPYILAHTQSGWNFFEIG